jgi:hypothetical protein
MSGYRVLVCGGRSYANRVRVDAVLDAWRALHGMSVLIHGAAPGADTLAAKWAARHGVPRIAEPALWAQYGNAAGPIRNQKMLDDHAPDVVIAFAGYRGTPDMKDRARKAQLPVFEGDAPGFNNDTRLLVASWDFPVSLVGRSRRDET